MDQKISKCDTLWLFNIAMENGSFIDVLWRFTYKKMMILQFATLNNRRVSHLEIFWSI
jgi:hypothetical protein